MIRRTFLKAVAALFAFGPLVGRRGGCKMEAVAAPETSGDAWAGWWSNGQWLFDVRRHMPKNEIMLRFRRTLAGDVYGSQAYDTSVFSEAEAQLCRHDRHHLAWRIAARLLKIWEEEREERRKAVLARMNEAIALDYVIPYRVIGTTAVQRLMEACCVSDDEFDKLVALELRRQLHGRTGARIENGRIIPGDA